jgi:aminobenzoyl-glutamate utilization protein B
MFLMARSPSGQTLDGIWQRIVKISEGAALMTGTTAEVKIVSSDANIIANDALAPIVQKNLEEVGGYQMTAEQKLFAGKLQKTLSVETLPSFDQTNDIQPLKPFDPNAPAASTDVGDISWTVPTIGLTTATFVPGVAAHTWQAASSAGTSVGQDGMVVASKALALTALDLFTTPKLVVDAKLNFDKQMAGKTYLSPIPADQRPPLNYRDDK